VTEVKWPPFGANAPCRPKRGSAKYLPEGEREGIALCLSGGGYRAALFHLGALRRLNELGTLARLDAVSAVSGGSILAAFLAERVRPWPRSGAIENFDALIAHPFRQFTTKNIRTLWILERAVRPWDSTVAVRTLVRRYCRDVSDLWLRELPERPRFIFSATDMAFGVNWVFERQRMGDYQVGYHSPPPDDYPAGRAAAASACFPPLFEPLPIGLEPARFAGGAPPLAGEDRNGLIRGLRLTDGGVYDNMGLEPVWKRYAVVLVSDGGATFDFRPDRGLLKAFRRLGRYTGIQGRQAGALRKRWLISNFHLGELSGAYWGIGSDVTNYDAAFEGYPEQLVDELISEVRTDLDYFSDGEAAVLQNHGYLLADAAMRCHGRAWIDGTPAAEVPFPEWIEEGRVRQALGGSHKRRILGRWQLWRR
jgi:NTE family protein